MNPYIAVMISLVLPSALAIIVALALRGPLFNLLVELCGNTARAGFWAIFCVMVTILSTLFGVLALLPLSTAPLAQHTTMVMTLSSIRAGIFGLLMALVAIALILLSAIEKHDAAARA